MYFHPLHIPYIGIMKKLLFILATSCLTLSCSSQQKIKGDRDVISVNGDLATGINTIEVSNDIKVRLVKANSNDYILTTDRNLVSVVDFNVNDSILSIKTNMKVTGSKEMEVYVKLIDPQHIILHDDAEIRTPGYIETSNFSLNGSSGSRFDLNITSASAKVTLRENSGGELNLKGDHFNLDMTGRTDLEGEFTTTDKYSVTLKDNAEFAPKGKTEYLTLITEGKADFKGRRLTSQEAEATLSSRSNAAVFAQKSLSIFAKDKSKIEVYGSPDVNVKNLGDSAEIVKK